jgi:hypothetical protein
MNFSHMDHHGHHFVLVDRKIIVAGPVIDVSVDILQVLLMLQYDHYFMSIHV